MFGEKHVRPKSLRGMNEDRSIFGGQNNSMRRMAGNGVTTPTDQRPLRQSHRPERHRGQRELRRSPRRHLLFVLCDGTVRGVSVDTSLPILSNMMMRADGNTITFDPYLCRLLLNRCGDGWSSAFRRSINRLKPELQLIHLLAKEAALMSKSASSHSSLAFTPSAYAEDAKIVMHEDVVAIR